MKIKNELQPNEIDSSRMPVKLGSALRVPSYAYPAWGITGDEKWLREESDRQYEIEWKDGTEKQMQNVVAAITKSGLGDYSQKLRDSNASLVAEAVKKAEREVNYLELGAGVSTINVYNKLKSEGLDLQKLKGTLVEPSKERIETAAAKLEGLGLKLGRDFKIYAARDVDIPKFVEPNSQDIASYVAVVHHHADLDTPLRCVYNALAPGGKIIIADWHNAMWEHPNRVFELLKSGFDWPTKDDDLKAFVSKYTRALEHAPELSPLDAASNAHIGRFWQCYGKVEAEQKANGTFNPNDRLVMLEAHRPVERQNEVLQHVGYKKITSERLVPDAGILYVTQAWK
jgi:SAM-dependent methyltransferase